MSVEALLADNSNNTLFEQDYVPKVGRVIKIPDIEVKKAK